MNLIRRLLSYFLSELHVALCRLNAPVIMTSRYELILWRYVRDSCTQPWWLL